MAEAYRAALAEFHPKAFGNAFSSPPAA